MGSPTKGFRFVEGTQMLARRSPKYLFFHSEPFAYCHSEPFACHSERSEGSGFLAQDKLREVSHRINNLKNRDSSLPAGRQRLNASE